MTRSCCIHINLKTRHVLANFFSFLFKPLSFKQNIPLGIGFFSFSCFLPLFIYIFLHKSRRMSNDPVDPCLSRRGVRSWSERCVWSGDNWKRFKQRNETPIICRFRVNKRTPLLTGVMNNLSNGSLQNVIGIVDQGGNIFVLGSWLWVDTPICLIRRETINFCILEGERTVCITRRFVL